MFLKMLDWIDAHPQHKRAKVINQFFPVVVCLILLISFIGLSVLFITQLINPFSTDKILIHLQPIDVAVGFFLYFVTAVDYALIVGRMQNANRGIRARFVMNVCTCLGCFIGVSLVMFVWGFAKEIEWLITALLIFAGSVMVKLAYEGLEYFEDVETIWRPLRQSVSGLVRFLNHLTEGLTFWIPELASPDVKKMPLSQLALWSFFLPFIIGLDDFVGYMGAMTIYNVFSLLCGIYLADILIDILIFISPQFTKKMVENAYLSLLATLAFLYLTYKSFHEAWLSITHTHSHQLTLIYSVAGVCLLAYLIGRVIHKKTARHAT